jgi:hypothetical protein
MNATPTRLALLALLPAALLACSGGEAPKEKAEAKPAAPPAAPAKAYEPMQEPLVGPASPTILLSQAWFTKNAAGKSVPGPARLQIWRQGAEGWKASRLEDADSNVFHKALLRDGKIITISGEKANLKVWSFADGKWSQETLWTKSWGGKFNRIRDIEVGDVNGDNYDDIIISARRGREPIVTALDGRDIVNGVADPEKCFTFVAGNPDDMGGVQVAVGFVAPSSVPSYLPNLITSAESGQRAGVVKVWNMADICTCGSHDSHGTMAAMDMSSSSEDMPATPVAVFRPFGTRRGAVQIASTYQSMLGGQAKPVIAAWQAGREVAFSSIGLDNKPQTQVRKF